MDKASEWYKPAATAFTVTPLGRLTCTGVDWLAVVVLIVAGTLWMWLNNRVLHLGDTLFHMLRGDAILLLGVLAALDARWLPIAVVVSFEHLAYALTKLVALRRSWYRDGAELVAEDADRLGLAFHRRDDSERRRRSGAGRCRRA